MGLGYWLAFLQDVFRAGGQLGGQPAGEVLRVPAIEGNMELYPEVRETPTHIHDCPQSISIPYNYYKNNISGEAKHPGLYLYMGFINLGHQSMSS